MLAVLVLMAALAESPCIIRSTPADVSQGVWEGRAVQYGCTIIRPKESPYWMARVKIQLQDGEWPGVVIGGHENFEKACRYCGEWMEEVEYCTKAGLEHRKKKR